MRPTAASHSATVAETIAATCIAVLYRLFVQREDCSSALPLNRAVVHPASALVSTGADGSVLNGAAVEHISFDRCRDDVDIV